RCGRSRARLAERRLKRFHNSRQRVPPCRAELPSGTEHAVAAFAHKAPKHESGIGRLTQWRRSAAGGRFQPEYRASITPCVFLGNLPTAASTRDPLIREIDPARLISLRPFDPGQQFIAALSLIADALREVVLQVFKHHSGIRN